MLMERIGLIWVEFQLANKDEGQAKEHRKVQVKTKNMDTAMSMYRKVKWQGEARV